MHSFEEVKKLYDKIVSYPDKTADGIVLATLSMVVNEGNLRGQAGKHARELLSDLEKLELIEVFRVKSAHNVHVTCFRLLKIVDFTDSFAAISRRIYLSTFTDGQLQEAFPAWNGERNF